jgi:hypothetical protein
MSAPEILSIRRRNGIAGQYAYDVKVSYTHGDGTQETTAVTFTASGYGAPGPVVMVTDTMQVHVTNPGQYGDTLSPQWIRNFYAPKPGTED